jgi:hypothetical protein
MGPEIRPEIRAEVKLEVRLEIGLWLSYLYCTYSYLLSLSFLSLESSYIQQFLVECLLCETPFGPDI